MKEPFIKKRDNKKWPVKIASFFTIVILLGVFLSVSAISLSNYFSCESATKDYKISRAARAEDSTGKFSDMLLKCQKHRQFDEKVFSTLSITWLFGLPIFFIVSFLAIWAYVIRKHGILLGGSVGIVPPVIIASVLVPFWPLIMLATVFVSAFKDQCIEIIKDRYLEPFRVKTALNS